MGNKRSSKKKISKRKRSKIRKAVCALIPRNGNRFGSKQNKEDLTKKKKLLESAGNPTESPEGEPKPIPEPMPEPRFAFRVPSPSELTEGRGKRSCRIQQCAFKSCPTNVSPDQRDHIKFFRFPRQHVAHGKWVRTVSRERGETFVPKLNSVVCALHFRSWETYVDGSGQAKLLPTARPRPEPYSQEEVNREMERLEMTKNETSIRNEVNEREEKKIGKDKKRLRKNKKIAEIVLPNFVPEVRDLNIKKELDDSDSLSKGLNTSMDGFGNILPIERNPLKIEESTELERAVQSITDKLPPAENAIKLQYLDLNSQSATVHFLSVDSGNVVNVGHTQLNIQKDNIATLNYVDGNNTVKHTLRCVNMNEDPVHATLNPLPIDNLTNKEMSINESIVNTAPNTSYTLPRTDVINLNTKMGSADEIQNIYITNPISLSTDNRSESVCINNIKEEPIIHYESDGSDGSDSETVVKMEIEEYELF